MFQSGIKIIFFLFFLLILSCGSNQRHLERQSNINDINRSDSIKLRARAKLKFERISAPFTDIFADQFEDKVAARRAWEDGGGLVLMRIYDTIYPSIDLNKFHAQAIKVIKEAKEKDPNLSLKTLSFIALEGLLEPENKMYNVMYQIKIIDGENIISPIWGINPEANQQNIDVNPLLVRMPGTNILYLKIPQFTEQISIANLEKEFDISLQGHKGPIVIDIRNNAGGLLERVIDISSYFGPQDKTIFKVKKAKGQQDIYRTSRNTMKDITTTITGPILVLINENTNSGAFILAAALKEMNIAKIAGNSIKTVNDKIRTVMPQKECPTERYNCMSVISTGVVYLGSDKPLSDGLIPDFPVDWNTENALEKTVSAWLE